MAIKYSIQYQDVVNVTHRFEIHDEVYVGDEIEVQGIVYIEYGSIDNLLTPIKGSNIRVELEANTTLNYNDLFAKEERSFLCYYYRDSNIKFKGWLNPEGWYEDYVVDKWIVSFDCVDGLGYLDNLSYVDVNGLTFSGIQTGLEVISNCLKRTGIEQNINVKLNYIYWDTNYIDPELDGYPIEFFSYNILQMVNLNSNRFIKDDEETIMSCGDVLKSILGIFAACITQRDGEWFIYKPNLLYDNTNIQYTRFDYNGIELSPSLADLETSITIGSNVDDFYPHHCSENQSIRNEKGLAAFRVHYKYGIVKSYLDNIYLWFDGSVIDDWNIISTTNMELLVSGESGITFNNVQQQPYYVDVIEQLTSDSILLTEGEQTEIYINYISTYIKSRATVFNYKVILSDVELPNGGAVIKYLQDDFTWGLTDNIITYNNWSGTQINADRPLVIPVELKITTPATDFVGSSYLYLSIYTPQGYPKSGTTTYGQTELEEIKISPYIDPDSAVVNGEFHTVQRTVNPSSKIEVTKEVYTGDNLSDAYTGVLYEYDKETPTNYWFRGIAGEEKKAICRLMAEDTLRLNAKTARIFSGDVFGYFDYLSTISINNLDGKYLPLSYSNNTKENIISMEVKQIYGDDLDDMDYELTYDYGNVVEPTIKG